MPRHDMAKTVAASINPRLLNWARVSLGLDIKTAAKRLGIPMERLERCEDGTEQLTIAQLKKAATVYKRPVAIFYLKDVPASVDPLPDFRRVPQSQGNPLSPGALLQIRRIYDKQRTALEIAASGLFEWDFVGSLKPNGIDAEQTGERIRKMLGVERVGGWTNDYESFGFWRRSIERLGVLVFQIVRVAVDEVRGFSIAAESFPAIALNRADHPKPRTFTLLHEFCHILIGQSGVCDISDPDQENTAQAKKVEEFCNQLAGAVLIPWIALRENPVVSSHGNSKQWSQEELRQLSDYFRISREAVLRRLLVFQLTTPQFYKQWRDQYAHMESQMPSREGFGEKAFQRTIRTQGQNYVRLVLDALQNDSITAAKASDYLEMKTQHLADLERVVYK